MSVDKGDRVDVLVDEVDGRTAVVIVPSTSGPAE